MNHHSVRRNYDRLSHGYDLITGSEKRFTETGLQMLDIQPGEQVLEIGFGTGKSLVALAGAVAGSGRVYGLDISAGMISITRSRLRRLKLDQRVDLLLGDAVRLPFQNAFFDALFFSFTLELFTISEIPLVLNECKRVLRSGGRIGLVALGKGETPAVNLYEWAHARMPGVLDCHPIRSQALVRAAGCDIVDSSIKSMWGLPVEIILARRP